MRVRREVSEEGEEEVPRRTHVPSENPLVRLKVGSSALVMKRASTFYFDLETAGKGRLTNMI